MPGFRNDKNFHGNFDVFVEQKDHNNRGVSVQQTELFSRPRGSARYEFFKIEAESTNFSKDMLQSSNTRNRLICIKVVPPVKKYISWRPDPLSQGTNAIE